MSRWYYIGNGSSFDGDMDFTEKIINYVEIGKPEDIDVLYFYYRSAILSYWIKLEEIFSLEDNYDSILTFIKPKVPYEYEWSEKIIIMIENIKKYIQPDRIFYKNVLNQKIEHLESSYKNLMLEITESGKFNFIREILTIFEYIATLNCGDKWTEDNITTSKYYLFPLTNESGWFSYNSYLYALSRGLHIMGVPSGISNYDGNYSCPLAFLGHDYEHLEDLERVLDRTAEDDKTVRFYEMSETYKLAKYYDFIMKSNYTSNEKEIFLFTIWFIIHEKRKPLDFSNINMTDVRDISTRYVLYGVHLNFELLNEAYEIALNYANPQILRSLTLTKRNITQGKKITQEQEDHYNATLALIYGIHHLKVIDVDVP
jgi:hypothetical protein